MPVAIAQSQMAHWEKGVNARILQACWAEGCEKVKRELTSCTRLLPLPALQPMGDAQKLHVLHSRG